jgi:2-methylcitrate dehydratase PrpD
MTSASAVLGAWIAGCGNNHGVLAYERATMALVDTVSCMFVGRDAEPTRRAREVIGRWGGGMCTLVGYGQSSAPWAALVNGTAAHALDFDDNDTPAASHPSAVLLPCLLAMAEERGYGGREVLDAYIVGLEVMSRIGEAVNMAHYGRGWHATATLGVLGGAASCARLLRLDRVAAANSVSLATSMASGLRSQFGTMAKPLHAGLAAKSAVIAAALAETGFCASVDALDGPLGFRAILAGEESRGFADLEHTLGQPLAIIQYGLSVKCYPCCYYSARSIDAVLELRRQHDFLPRDIDRVVVELSDRNSKIVAIEDPKTTDEARFSLRYCVAVAIVRGKLTIDDFTNESIGRSDWRELTNKIEIRPYRGDAVASDLSANEPDTVTIHFSTRTSIAQVIQHPRGSAAAPLPKADVLVKLRECTRGLSVGDVDALENVLFSFEQLTSLDAFMRLLRQRPPPA